MTDIVNGAGKWWCSGIGAARAASIPLRELEQVSSLRNSCNGNRCRNSEHVLGRAPVRPAL